MWSRLWQEIMFIREHIGFLDFDKNSLYKFIRHDNMSWMENVKRFSHNFSTLLFQPPNFFVRKNTRIFMPEKIFGIE